MGHITELAAALRARMERLAELGRAVEKQIQQSLPEVEITKSRDVVAPRQLSDELVEVVLARPGQSGPRSPRVCLRTSTLSR